MWVRPFGGTGCEWGLTQTKVNFLLEKHMIQLVYSILPQSTQLRNGYLALIRQCLERVRYMLPAALEYHTGYWNGFRVYGAC